MATKPSLLSQLIIRYVARLRFPYLVGLAAGFFLVDLIVPDFIPFADEILLGLATIILAQIKRPDPAPPVVDANRLR